MHRFLPAKRAMMVFYLLLALVGVAVDFLLYNYVSMLSIDVLKMISMVVWAAIIVTAVFIVPHYFVNAKVVLTKTEIAAAGGFVTYRNDYMPITAVKSVSSIITPLGTITGLNFVVVNALGTRLIIPFLRKGDALELTSLINDLVKQREEEAHEPHE